MRGAAAAGDPSGSPVSARSGLRAAEAVAVGRAGAGPKPHPGRRLVCGWQRERRAVGTSPRSRVRGPRDAARALRG